MSQVVVTNNRCVGCNRCISACSCAGANIAQNIDGRNVIIVNSDRCIGCGDCISVCEHGARNYADDTQRFLMTLKKERKFLLS